MARIALPVSVCVMKSHSTSTISPAPKSTMMLCGRRAAPPTMIGLLPANGASEWKFLSNTIEAMPRIKIEAPMVMMMRLTADAPRAGAMAR